MKITYELTEEDRYKILKREPLLFDYDVLKELAAVKCYTKVVTGVANGI